MPKPVMHRAGKSDAAIGAGKRANPAELAGESVERRAAAKGNGFKPATCRTQSRESVTAALERIRQHAKQGRGRKFTALLHHVGPALLEVAFFDLKRHAAAGVDGVTWEDYVQGLDDKLADLAGRIHRGGYRAQPSRRRFIPKPDGRQRPLAIAALEDKIVQRAVALVLEAIYEEEFLGFSYGFRPGRGQHDALDALAVAIQSRNVNHILDADIERFFDTVSHEWLMRMLERRIGDKRILRLIAQWLKVGILEDGIETRSDEGTGQGSVISPLLANIYLHHVFDLWANRWRGCEAKGDMIVVRYADDIVLGFQHESEARRFQEEMRTRMESFALKLHPEKTRLIAFGRFAAAGRKSKGLGKPETFTFLGFTHICGTSRAGRFQLKRRSRRDRMRAKLETVKEDLRRRMHEAIEAQGRWLGQVVRGYFNYHAVPTNGQALAAFRYHVSNLWRRTLKRRGQKDRTTWTDITRLADAWLPKPRITHPWPSERFAVRHPR